jgi:hypothetical protein
MLRVEVCLDMTTSARAGRLLIPVLLVFVLLAGCLVMECLQVSVNNCNGGILEVSNSCAEILFLSRITIHPGETNVGLDLARENDEYFFQRADSNFSEYIPAEDEPVEILGMMGAVEVRITFTKTAELC